mmetsp:Transcript_72140/g.197504  ORF Transcript_72140/g.197504 Transcript_72140/m.197504 type:complete len:290 (+) Transcript_72140:787-1656(+)
MVAPIGGRVADGLKGRGERGVAVEARLGLRGALAVGAVPLARHETLGEHLPPQHRDALLGVKRAVLGGRKLGVGPDGARGHGEADLRRIDDGSRLADTLGVRDRLTQAREVPVAHSPRRKAALLLQPIHHVDNLGDGKGGLVAVQQVDIDEIDAHHLERVHQVGPDLGRRQVGRPQLVLPAAATLGDEHNLFALNLPLAQPHAHQPLALAAAVHGGAIERIASRLAHRIEQRARVLRLAEEEGAKDDPRHEFAVQAPHSRVLHVHIDRDVQRQQRIVRRRAGRRALQRR